MRALISLFYLRDRPDASTSFLFFYVNRSLYSIRLAFILAFILYGVFGFLDNYMAPDSKHEIWIIRYGMVMPILFLAYLFSFSGRFVHYAQGVLFATSLTVGFGVLAIILCTDTHELGYRHYYSGLILTIIATHTLWRLKSELALLSTCSIIVSYNLSAIYIQSFRTPEDLTVLLSNDFFLISAAIIGAWASYASEKMFQIEFTNIRILLKEKEELALSRKQLDEASLMKSKLLSIISHDLRSPINSVKGILQLYSSGYITTNELRNHSKYLESLIESASNLLDNLLSWSIEQIDGKFPERKKILLFPIVANVFQLVGSQAREKSINLINEINEEMLLMADASVVNLVLRNLISNAIKYTQNGTVRVMARQFDNTIEISVADNGRGIPDDIAANLFIWKKRRDFIQAGTKAERGSGLGLMICKEFIEKAGGRLFFTTKEHKGTTFSFTIPGQPESELIDSKKIAEPLPC